MQCNHTDHCTKIPAWKDDNSAHAHGAASWPKDPLEGEINTGIAQAVPQGGGLTSLGPHAVPGPTAFEDPQGSNQDPKMLLTNGGAF